MRLVRMLLVALAVRVAGNWYGQSRHDAAFEALAREGRELAERKATTREVEDFIRRVSDWQRKETARDLAGPPGESA